MNGIIKFCGVRPGSQMENKTNLRLIHFEPLKKVVALNSVRKFFSAEIIYFVQTAEFIYQYELIKSFFIQKTRETTANKSGRTGHYDIGRLVHTSTVDSISFSMAVSYAFFHS